MVAAKEVERKDDNASTKEPVLYKNIMKRSISIIITTIVIIHIIIIVITIEKSEAVCS